MTVRAKGTRSAISWPASLQALWRSGSDRGSFEPPAISGIGSFGGFQFELQDLGRNTLQDVDTVRTRLWVQSPALRPARIVYQLHANDPPAAGADRSREAKAIGVPIVNHAGAGRLHGSQYVNDFDFNNRSYRVYVTSRSAIPHYRTDCGNTTCARTRAGWCPWENRHIAGNVGSQVINHYNFSAPRKSTALQPRGTAQAGPQGHEELARQEHAAGHVVPVDRARA